MRIKNYLPKFIKKFAAELRLRYYIYKSSRHHTRELQRLKNEKKIKVAFLLINESIWKYDYLYFLLQKDSRYEPVVFICPFLNYGDELMRKEMEQIYLEFKKRGYTVRKTLEDDGSFLDIKSEFKPDLVFFCTSWSHPLKKYQIRNFSNTLTCYVPYAFMTSFLFDAHYNKELHKLVWKYFLPTKEHFEFKNRYEKIKVNNALVTGYPGMDVFLDKEYKPHNAWKKQENLKKKIIWAPHHTIPGVPQNALDYSTFLTYAEGMIDLAKTLQKEVQFAFKPHPNLRGKLYSIWGERKTNAYYKKWMDMPNGQLEEGSYIDLFATSDAMIHDSSSFLIEYLYTRKPVLFLISSEEVKEQFNEIGKEALSHIQKGYNEADIRDFIENSVIKGNDMMAEKRNDFFDKLIKPPHNKMASENIYEYINQKINNL